MVFTFMMHYCFLFETNYKLLEKPTQVYKIEVKYLENLSKAVYSAQVWTQVT